MAVDDILKLPNGSRQRSRSRSLSEEIATIRQSNSGISVLIIGAGTAGAFAALECWRKGHDVRILEKAPGPYAMGDAYSIGPSAVKAFRHWPGMSGESERISYNPWLVTRKLNGEIITPAAPLFDESKPDAPSKLHRHLRPRFQRMLLDYIERTGIVVEWDNRVVQYFNHTDSRKAGVVLFDGTIVEADVVVAADGVGTKSTKAVTGIETPARSSGYSIYRTAYPVEYVLVDPVVDERFPSEIDGHHIAEMWMGEGVHGSVQRTEDTMTWTMTHKDTGTAEESWSSAVDPAKVLKLTSSIPGWPEDLDRLIKTAPNNAITDFKLVWRDPQPRWVSDGGRIVQIGDAAHTFLPSSGNGATQGIEDAVSLATCLSLGGPEEVPQALRIHNVLRRDRVSCAQLMGIVSQSHRHSIKTDAFENDNDQMRKATRYGKWLWSHDAEQYTLENFERAKLHLNDNAPFRNTNIPRGYTCRPWTIADILDNPEAGEAFIVEGDWS